MAAVEKVNTYEKWLEKEGLPVIRDYSVPDLMAVPLKPWARKGGLGAYINLIGSDGAVDAYLCEIPPASSLLPQKHLFEEIIYILSGYGATTVWVEGGAKQSFEWHEGSLFSPPLNSWHQHFNGQREKPTRYIAVTRAPLFINLFHDLDFILNNDYVFKSRYHGEEGYFSNRGKLIHSVVDPRPRVWETNFVPDCRAFKLLDGHEKGGGDTTIRFQMSNNLQSAHVSQYDAGVYLKAHYHQGGSHLIILSGQGFSLMWPKDSGIMAEGVKRVRVDWQKNSLFCPPDRWFHQHFSTGKEPARQLAIHAERSLIRQGIMQDYGLSAKDIKLGGTQIEYEDEDPLLRKLFKEEIAKTGAPWNMSKYLRHE